MFPVTIMPHADTNAYARFMLDRRLYAALALWPTQVTYADTHNHKSGFRKWYQGKMSLGIWEDPNPIPQTP